MFKRIQFIILLILLLFPGCLNYTQSTIIKTDYSGEMFIHYWINFDSNSDSTEINKIQIFNRDKIQQEFSNSFTTIDTIEIYKDFSDSTLHSKIQFEFSHIDSLVKLKTFMSSRIEITEEEDFMVFEHSVPPFLTGFGFDSKDFTAKYIYYLPGNIVSHNADEKTLNKLTWEFDLSELSTGKTLTAKYVPFKLKETPEWIYYLSIFVLLVVIFYLLKKKKL